jgi:hypothetical protein
MVDFLSLALKHLILGLAQLFFNVREKAHLMPNFEPGRVQDLRNRQF